jgi:hypothetical protein
MPRKVLGISYNTRTPNIRARVYIKLIPIICLISSFFIILLATFRKYMISEILIF